MPSDDMMRDGGRMHGFQLWVNLPAAEKMVPPRYQEFPASEIPIATNEEGVWVRVIAGSALGIAAIIETHMPIMYLHFVLQPGATHVQPVPADFNAFAYLLGGEGTIGNDGTHAKDGDIVILERDGDAASLANTGTEPLSILLVAGVPLGEPVARYGPFVMNTADEIQQAFADYHAGRMGQISG
jgi:redox-sensitive bicupin YhaK (pirin superfamily)